MKEVLSALFLFLRRFPDAQLLIVYQLIFKNKDGSKSTVYTKNKKLVKKFKHDKSTQIKRKLICRTLY